MPEISCNLLYTQSSYFPTFFKNHFHGDTATLRSYVTEDNLQIIGHGATTLKINSMDKDTLIKPTKHADGVEPHRSKLAHPSKTSTKNQIQEADEYSGYKTNFQTKCDSTKSCPASSHDIEDGLAPGMKHKITPAKTWTDTSNTKVTDHFSDWVDNSEPKQDAKKTKVVKKGIAQIVKKKQKKGGWKYVDEY